jgi:hypothetical protein
MIKEEIKHRQDIEYLHNGTIPNTFYASISKIKLNNYLTDNVANTIIAQKVHNVLVTKQWNLHNVYLSNLHDIRTSIRLQKKKELRQEKKLEQLREKQLLLSHRRSHSRTKRYNQKARRKLIFNGTKPAVFQSENLEQNLQHLVTDFKVQASTMVSADDSIAINIDSDKAMVSMDDSRLQLHVPLESSMSPSSTPQMHLQPQVFPAGRHRKRPKMIIVD